MKKTDLDTPCLILDIDIFTKNLSFMCDSVVGQKKMLRPHVKTHKCSAIAIKQLAQGGCGRLCAAKVSEAQKLIECGITNILITSPLVTRIALPTNSSEDPLF